MCGLHRHPAGAPPHSTSASPLQRRPASGPLDLAAATRQRRPASCNLCRAACGGGVATPSHLRLPAATPCRWLSQAATAHPLFLSPAMATLADPAAFAPRQVPSSSADGEHPTVPDCCCRNSSCRSSAVGRVRIMIASPSACLRCLSCLFHPRFVHPLNGWP